MSNFRVRAARGVLVNGAYLVGLNFLNLIKGFIAAGLVATTDYGIWGILSVTLVAMLWLKEMGVQDRFVAQNDEDQEAAFQEAFSVELLLTGTLFLLMLTAMPLLAVIYGYEDLVAPGLVLALLLPGLALQAPIWLHYRELRFVAQRRLQAIDPILSFVLTIGLAIAGAGYWSFVIATVVGTWATAIVALRSSPYKIRWRLPPGVLKSYVGFSWPLFVAAFNGLIMTQLAIILGEQKLGLVGVASLTLAATIVRHSQRVDNVITSTLFPVVTKVQDRPDLLLESFMKSNRLALMWATPFGVAFGLFAPDLVEFGLGEDWRSAVVILQLIGISCVFNQIGFNWTAYYRGAGHTRPLAIASCIALVVFFLVPIPLLYEYGLAGYGWGMVAMSLFNALVRSHYLRKLFPKLRMAPHALRAMSPTLPPLLVIGAMRLGEAGERELWMALLEFATFSMLTVISAVAFERRLLREIIGYLGRPRPATTAQEPEVATH
jgi:O-antigen/teichoic acid export membrane protein